MGEGKEGMGCLDNCFMRVNCKEEVLYRFIDIEGYLVKIFNFIILFEML